MTYFVLLLLDFTKAGHGEGVLCALCFCCEFAAWLLGACSLLSQAPLKLHTR